MRSLVWAATALVTCTALVAMTPEGRRLQVFQLPARVYATVVLWLGTKTIVSRTNVEVLSAGEAMETVVRGGLALIALTLVAPHLPEALRLVRRNRAGLILIMAYVVVAGLSIMWSAAPLPTAGKVLELGVALVIVGSATVDARPHAALRQLLHLILALWTAMLATAVVGYAAAPSFFQLEDTRGGFIMPSVMGAPYAHSNNLSAIAAILAVYAVARWLRSPRSLWVALGLLGGVGLLLAAGRQGVLMAAVGVSAVLLIERRRWFLAGAVPMGVWALWILRADVMEVLARGQSTAQLYTLTGRMEWWGLSIQAIRDRPWTGYGFGSGGRFGALAGDAGSLTSSVHNGLFEALLGVGVIGTVFLLSAMLLTLVWACRMARSTYMPYAALLLPLIVRSGLSNGIGGWVNEELLYFMVIVAIRDLRPMPVRQFGSVSVHRAPQSCGDVRQEGFTSWVSAECPYRRP